MKRFSFVNGFGRKICLALADLRYEMGGRAVMAYEVAEEGLEAYACLTVCLPDCSFLLGKNQAFLDANNHPWALEWLEQNGIAKRTGLYATSGFCDYPMVTFDPERLNTPEEFKEAGYMG